MVDQSELRRRQALTFEEAEGLVPTPTQFRDGELTREFRNGVWTAFYRMFSDNRLAANYSARPTFAPLLAGILFRELLNRRQTPIDEADKRIKNGDADVIISDYKSTILHGRTHDLMGLIQWILRDPACPQSFKQDMRQLFERMPSPYSLLGSPSTILPSTSAEERQRVECGLTEVNRSPLVGAKSHLSYASQALSDGKYAEAIRESILAIEGTASTIIGKKATLSDALKVLERDKALHPALKQSFDKLYAYTNDEQGLRHALVSADTASVDEAEAIFMFEASVAFIAFLNRKYLTSSS